MQSKDVYAAIGDDKLDFTVGNNQYLQGALGIILATLAVTEGQSLAGRTYNTGPQLLTKANVPSDTIKVCEADAFPVCPNDKVRITGLYIILSWV
jgi:ABC-type sugar transport system substrate-binding protein